jgi:hypothetical protein
LLRPLFFQRVSVNYIPHTCLSLLDIAQATQAAGATIMLEDLTKTQASVQQSISAPHPALGTANDIQV